MNNSQKIYWILIALVLFLTSWFWTIAKVIKLEKAYALTSVELVAKEDIKPKTVLTKSVPITVSNVMERILTTGVVEYDDVKYHTNIQNTNVLQALLVYLESPTNSLQISAKLSISQRLNIPVHPQDVLLGMAWADGVSLFRSRRTMFNKIVFSMAVKDARQNGQPTVGVVIPKYKAVIDGENTGTNFIEAISALGIAFPLNWNDEKTVIQSVIEEIYNGNIFAPTDTEIARIEFYKGVLGLNEFVRRYNEL